MLDTDTIHACEFHHPVQNLNPKYEKSPGPEAEFTDLFAASYQVNFLGIHPGVTRRRTLFVREVPVNGNGIADLVVLNWKGRVTSASIEKLRFGKSGPIIRAFEVKLSDWRGGLMQAYRYKYFSHASVLVVPRKKLETIKNHIDIFLTVRVGLWGFDPDSGKIIRTYTPRPKRQMIDKYGETAISTVVGAALT
jgi:hypothetical protein